MHFRVLKRENIIKGIGLYNGGSKSQALCQILLRYYISQTLKLTRKSESTHLVNILTDLSQLLRNSFPKYVMQSNDQ
jgi:hypothetical protein